MTGMFIAFEGGEGSGKTSAIAEALETIENITGRQVVRTREPGGTPNAEQIRSILISEGADHDNICNTLLFAAARRDHVERLIRPRLAAGDWVVTDRFILSTLAYQGAEGVDRDFIQRLHIDTTDALLPDHTIILDVDPRIGLERSNSRLAGEGSNESRFEGYDLAFHDRMRGIMLEYDLSAKTIIDASRPQDEVIEEVKKVVENLVNHWREIERTGA